jgi:hypothetical protein
MNIVQMHFKKSNLEAEALANALWEVLRNHHHLISLSQMIGITEMIKADVLDSMEFYKGETK